jgi:uncharacterized protein YkwD
MRKLLLTLIATLALTIAIPAASQAATKTSKRATSDEQQVLVLLNQIRQQHNLATFTQLPQLHNAARFHSSDMIAKSYFDHNSPTEAWDARVSRFLKSPLIGEDIAWGQGSYGTPEGIVSQWMHSPTHRAIILTPGLHHIGIGLATGTYQNAPGAIMATADFAA